MIVVRLVGGLGNQMFQYAAGRALSIAYNVPLLLDVSGFSNNGLHQGFELHRIFKGQIELADQSVLHEILGWRSYKHMLSLLLRPSMHWFHGRRFIVEPHFHYWEGIQNLCPPCYLSGYWQSEQYFSKNVTLIRDDFTFTQPLSGRNRDLAQEIGENLSISLHIRRGDYVSNPKALATHGVCSLEYYRLAMAFMVERLAEPRFYVFSDDPEWVRANLTADYPMVFVDHNRGADSFTDMHLMSLCQHHIIANSSFSWWGAWLNPSESKMVIAPERWFAKPMDTRDLIPQQWLRL